MIFPSPAAFCCCGNSMLFGVLSRRSSTGLYGSENKSSAQHAIPLIKNHISEPKFHLLTTYFDQYN